jgi:RES domain-containing protein
LADFFASFRDAPRAALSATVYRVVRSGVDPLSSRGSELIGGRYNLRGAKGVLYASLDKVTALHEAARALRIRGIDPADFGPRDWWAYELELNSNRVLDLTDQSILELLQIISADLTGGDVSRTRQIGRHAFEAGYEAIIAPSATHAGKNIVIFLSAGVTPPFVMASTAVNLSEIAQHP